jgi:hypothetical protein
VVHIWVDSSVTSIPADAFYERKKLAEVELCEGLVEIGERSFGWCNHSITNINIPNSLRRINDEAFYASFELLFVSMMALKVLENTHSLSASSPTFESHPSSLRFPIIFYGIVFQFSLSKYQKK